MLVLATVGLTHYLVLAAAVFCIGVWVMVTKRNAIGVLIGVELVLNASNINLVAMSRYLHGIDGQVVALFVIVLAAAEAAIAVAIVMNFYRNLATVDVDRGTSLKN